MKRVHIHSQPPASLFPICRQTHTDKEPAFSINFHLPSRKYYLAQPYWAAWTLIDLVRRKSTTFSHLQGKTLWPIPSSSLFCSRIGLSESMLRRSIQSNFHLVVKAVFFNFATFFFGFLLVSYPSNTTQMSLAHLHLPHPNDSCPPTWHARSMNVDDALCVRHFLLCYDTLQQSTAWEHFSPERCFFCCQIFSLIVLWW